MNLLESDD